ncbi:MAG TPA: TVP38/TMEM64 family protein [Candidatus Omnitrophica bacterium]|nr:TVP38/TMEM64 family protein [Candidatus Omnitrophota bacterium]
MGKLKSSPWLKLFLVITFLAVIFIALRFFNVDFSKITVESFKEKIDSFGIWGPVIYIVLYVLRPLILFPAAVFSASAGAIWGLQGLLYLLIGANLSAIAEFIIARYFAREAVEKLIKGKFNSIDQAVEKNGFVTVLLIRLIPNVAWDIQNLALGLTKVKFRDYVLATLIGILPGSFALVYFGSSFISVITNPKHFWKIIVAFIIFGAVYYLQQLLRKKQNEEPVTPAR